MARKTRKFEVDDLVIMPAGCDTDRRYFKCPMAGQTVVVEWTDGEITRVKFPKPVRCEFWEVVCGDKEGTLQDVCCLYDYDLKLVKRVHPAAHYIDKTNLQKLIP